MLESDGDYHNAAQRPSRGHRFLQTFFFPAEVLFPENLGISSQISSGLKCIASRAAAPRYGVAKTTCHETVFKRDVSCVLGR
jgi:hypothetical protein